MHILTSHRFGEKIIWISTVYDWQDSLHHVFPGSWPTCFYIYLGRTVGGGLAWSPLAIKKKWECVSKCLWQLISWLRIPGTEVPTCLEGLRLGWFNTGASYLMFFTPRELMSLKYKVNPLDRVTLFIQVFQFFCRRAVNNNYPNYPFPLGF